MRREARLLANLVCWLPLFSQVVIGGRSVIEAQIVTTTFSSRVEKKHSRYRLEEEGKKKDRFNPEKLSEFGWFCLQ